MTFNPPNSQAPYLQTSDYFPDNFDEFRVNILQLFRNIANVVNIREIAIYDLTEQLTGQQWFTSGNPQISRQTYRKVFSFSDASLIFNHNITGIVLCTKILGGFTDGTNFYSLPYVSTVLAEQIKVVVTPTQVIITKGGGAPAITNGVIILEYLKN